MHEHNMHHTAPMTKTRKVFYWLTTGFAALALLGIGIADLAHAPEMMKGLAHLGFPLYFATIIGVWKILGVIAIVTPGLPRLKEWAYAGFFFTLTGAAMSHGISGDPVGVVLFPLMLLGVVGASWALKPAHGAEFGRFGFVHSEQANMKTA